MLLYKYFLRSCVHSYGVVSPVISPCGQDAAKARWDMLIGCHTHPAPGCVLGGSGRGACRERPGIPLCALHEVTRLTLRQPQRAVGRHPLCRGESGLRRAVACRSAHPVSGRAGSEPRPSASTVCAFWMTSASRNPPGSSGHRGQHRFRGSNRGLQGTAESRGCFFTQQVNRHK